MNDTSIFVKFVVPGFHRWDGAPPHRDYLARSHRHLFHVEVRCQVKHDDREIEYHDLLDFSRAKFPGGEMGTSSCEHMARALGGELAKQFERDMIVTVLEDGECGSTVRVQHDANP